MPPAAARKSAPLVLVCGEDEFAVNQRARQLHLEWCKELGGSDHEILDANVTNSGEALKVLKRLREALQTLPFFGDAKVIWLQNCTFLGDERAASAQDLTAALADLAQELKAFKWENVRLLISAGKVDKRKTFYKTLDKIGTVEAFAGLSVNDRDWAATAEGWAQAAINRRQKEISSEALSELVSRVGPDARQLDNEAEKLALFVGDRNTIEVVDVETVCVRNKAARAFALGDAIGDRDLPRVLQRLDEELWEIKLDPQRSEIGLLYGLIFKVRALLLLQQMIREGWIKPVPDYGRFKAQLERVPSDHLPQDRRFNPLQLNPFVLFKALPQVQRYTEAELVRAMELLLRANQRLVSSSLDEALVLQQTLIEIVGSDRGTARGRSAPV